MAPLIEVKNLSRKFSRGDEEVLALRSVSFAIQAGEFVALTGSSGSGKSTLLSILGFLDAPTEGQYLFEGNAVEGLSEKQKARLRNGRVGFIFQSFHLLPKLTALANVIVPLQYAEKPLSRNAQEARAKKALERVGLQERMFHKPNELSGGQRQRVAIARALVNEPALLFADEPTGNLDSRTGEEIFQLFEALNAEGVTLIMVTHDRSLALRAKRIIELKDGSIAEDRYAAS